MPTAEYEHRSVTELLSLEGRVALVTGAARGIGLASARRLAEAGAAVFLADLDGAAAKAAADELARDGARTAGGALDVTVVDQAETVVADVVREFGSLDILVNNAGIYPTRAFPDLTPDEWRRVLAVNLDGATYASRAFVNARQGSPNPGALNPGVIVNITSTAAEKPSAPAVAAYTASKHALNGLTKALALELGPLGIRVVAVAPTLVNTPGLQEMLGAMGGAGITDVIDQIGANIPLGRTARPDDVARVVLFCVSDLAAFVTGSTVYADGGALTL